MKIGRVLLMLLRLGAALQLIVGLMLWAGYGYQYVGAHKMIGVAFVVVLWAVAILALTRRTNVGLALFAIVWGLVVAGLGFSQQTILIGDLHWIIRVAHLVVGLAVMPIAERLSRGVPPA